MGLFDSFKSSVPAVFRSVGNVEDSVGNWLDKNGSGFEIPGLTNEQAALALHQGAGGMRNQASGYATVGQNRMENAFNLANPQQSPQGQTDEAFFAGKGMRQPTVYEQEAWRLANEAGEGRNWQNYLSKAQDSLAKQRDYAAQQDMRSRVSEMIKKLSEPVDMNDEYTKKAMANAGAMASRSSYLRGIQGPLSNLNTQKSLQDTYAGINEARTTRNQNAVQGLVGLQYQDDASRRYTDNQLTGIQANTSNYLTGINNANANASAQAKYAQDLAQTQGIGGLVGGIAGGLVGLGTGNPGAILPFAQAGTGVGAGVSGMFSPVAPPSYPSYGGGRSSSSGTGGVKY